MESMSNEDRLYLGADNIWMHFKAMNLDKIASRVGIDGGDERPQDWVMGTLGSMDSAAGEVRREPGECGIWKVLQFGESTKCQLLLLSQVR